MKRSIAFAFTLLGLALPSAAQTPNAREVLAALGFPSGVKDELLAGKFVTRDVKATADRELTAGLAFLVKVPPKQLFDRLEGGLLLRVDPNVKTYGRLEGEGDLGQLAALELSPAQVEAYGNAAPGSKLNLSKQEIAAFQALKGRPAAQIQQQVKESLLARYRAYRAKGLDGIAPYARSGGRETDVAADLRRATEAAEQGLKRFVPGFYETLLHYPKGAEGLTQVFGWQSYEAHGEPVVLLSHGLAKDQGDAIVVCQRHYYVSGGYDAEQAIAGFLPVQEGTLVVYANRTSTGQVEGFGSGTKRALGGRVMASQLQGLFQKLQTSAPR